MRKLKAIVVFFFCKRRNSQGAKADAGDASSPTFNVNIQKMPLTYHQKLKNKNDFLHVFSTKLISQFMKKLMMQSFS